MIDIKALAVIKPSGDVDAQASDRYMQSFVPSSYNILEPLSDDPALRGVKPRLTAARLARIPLHRASSNQGSLIRKTANRSFRALPVMSTRVHYTRSKNNGGKASLVSSLDIEISPFSNEDVEIASVQMSLPEGFSADLVSPHLSRAWLHHPKDIAVYLFNLILDSQVGDGASINPAQTVDIAIDAIVHVSEACRPMISMRWKTGVDFPAALNPTYGAPGQSMQRQRRPTSLPFNTTLTTAGGSTLPALEADLPPEDLTSQPKSRQRAVSVSDLGVTVTFTAPRLAVVGEILKWSILVYNGSGRPRRLGLTALPKRKRDFKGHLSKPSTSSTLANVRSTKEDVADLKVDENLLYAMQKNGASSNETPWQVVSLTTEIRLGSLNPGACADVEMEFLPLSKGPLQLEAIRLTDLTSGDISEIRDLPDIISEEVNSGVSTEIQSA